MRVHELIEKLQQLNPNALVIQEDQSFVEVKSVYGMMAVVDELGYGSCDTLYTESEVELEDEEFRSSCDHVVVLRGFEL